MSGTATELATLGGGCFWCLDAVYRDLNGVSKVVSGYAGGHVPNPTYEQVCGKRTGHAEVVQVWYDPAIIGYEDILTIFWRIHDPTTRDRQGNDVGPQYRSAIFTHSDAQQRTAQALVDELNAQRVFGRPIVTEIGPLSNYFPAEAYHQRYFEKHPNQGYCSMVVAPKVAKFRKQFAERLRR